MQMQTAYSVKKYSNFPAGALEDNRLRSSLFINFEETDDSLKLFENHLKLLFIRDGSTFVF